MNRFISQIQYTTIAIFVVIAFVNCSSNTSDNNDKDYEDLQRSISRATFSDETTEFALNVIYEVGAEPYVGRLFPASATHRNETVWELTRSSYTSLFSTHPNRKLTIPDELSQMTELPDQNKHTWTADELVSLGDTIAPDFENETAVRPTLIFLNGLYKDDSNILGVHFTGTRFAFVFKDVVTDAGGLPIKQKYIEQSVSIHELGHLIGFTNAGVPTKANHEDPDHPHHTSDENCVMYWAVETQSSLKDFIDVFIGDNKLVLFGDKTLEDGRSFHP